MSGFPGKRKSQKEVVDGNDQPCKRLRFEEIILEATDTEDGAETVKRRRKLLRAVQLRKRYKYFCKKHDATYLIEAVRRENRCAARRGRDSLVRTFRELSVDVDLAQSGNGRSSADGSSSRTIEVNVENHTAETVKESFAKPKLLLRTKKRKKLLRSNNIGSDANEDDSDADDCVKPTIKKSKWIEKNQDLFNMKNLMDDDSDYETDYQKSRCSKRTVVKSLVVRKAETEDGFIFSEGEDYSLSDTDEDNRDCDCRYHENLKKKFFNYVYDSFSDDDLDLL